MTDIDIEFDPAKNTINIGKHGLTLSHALAFEWDTAIIRQDDRQDYGEARYIAVGYIGPRLHVMVFAKRRKALRIISLRKANRREEKLYATS